jgi:serine protease inhibitor
MALLERPNHMRITWTPRTALAGVLMFSSLIPSWAKAQPAETQGVVPGNTAFALELFNRLRTEPGNLFFSPFSISTALAITCEGARGETEKQMRQVLHLAGDPAKLRASFGELQHQLNEAGKTEGIELNIANALWAQLGHPFLPAFVNTAKGSFDANINQADFKARPGPTRDEINGWVAQKTKDKIRDILPPRSITEATRMVLANAIYFKGAWLNPFEKSHTSPQPFHLSPTRQADAPLMLRFDQIKYAETPEFQAVELPYRGQRLSMLVLLPRQLDGCAQLEEHLTPTLLARTITDLRAQKVQLFLPKFKLESSLDLNRTLSAMGMRDAFTSAADFSGMDGTRLLFISSVFHKAWGEVNEEGTEAAAATAVVVGLTAVRKSPPPPPVFRADHPFLFFIRDTASSALLFMGRLADPAH